MSFIEEELKAYKCNLFGFRSCLYTVIRRSISGFAHFPFVALMGLTLLVQLVLAAGPGCGSYAGL